MSKELFVSSTPHETKVAVVEEDQLTEIYFERENEYTLAGSIYKGRVTRVLPGMQSAFVEIGLERDAFLYVTDFFEPQDEEGEEGFETIPEDTGRGRRRFERPAAAALPPAAVSGEERERETFSPAGAEQHAAQHATQEEGPAASDSNEVRLRSAKEAKRPPIVNVILTASVLAGGGAEAAAAADFRNQNSIPAMRRRGSKKDTKRSRRLARLRVTSRSSCPAKTSPSIATWRRRKRRIPPSR